MKITKTKSGKYTTVIYVGKDASGKAHSKRFSARTKEELRQIVRDYQSTHAIYAESTAFSAALSRYIDARAPHRSISTLKGYKSIQRTLAARFSDFCAMSTDRITERDVQKIVNDCRKRDLSEKTIRNWIGLINAVLIESGCPAVHPIMPPRKIYDASIPSEGEVRMILCLLHNNWLEIPVMLALYGLRRGEICALTSDDVTPENLVHVHRACVVADDGAVAVQDVPKTQTSNRFVPVSPYVADHIRTWKTNPLTINNIYPGFARFLRQYRFPAYRFHDLRHFFVSYAHARGVVEADILAAGGWKTNHVMQTVYRQSMQRNRAAGEITSLIGM